jgi:hypothetical protein
MRSKLESFVLSLLTGQVLLMNIMPLKVHLIDIIKAKLWICLAEVNQAISAET